jgi:hypothetical protein
MAVIVPAADEEEHIGDCLSAVSAAGACLYRGTGIGVRIVVVLDRCQDRTAVIAGQFTSVELVTLNARNVGVARPTGAHQVLNDGGRASELWLTAYWPSRAFRARALRTALAAPSLLK